jgi:GMP synthase (glutamine-hydrolysing)
LTDREVSPLRISFVITEHEDGLTPERAAQYEAIRARMAALTSATVETEQYWAPAQLTGDAVILSGSADPWAMHDEVALERFYDALRSYPRPVLGICAGMQMLVRAGGGVVGPSARTTRGFETVDVLDDSDLFAGSAGAVGVFESHEDEVTTLPPGFRVLATSSSCAVEAVASDERPWWGTQFHPEAWDEEHPAGRAILSRFLELAGTP